ncbi:MAG: GNAT family N-acetyltransferase [Desulfobacterota bacterium]|nr:GNAT family N-acetyltransferase [Thermodesulfobacteriota bacterium]
MIRPFTLSDLNAILAIERQSFPKSPYDRRTFIRLHALFPQQFLVYSEPDEGHQEKVLGYIVFTPEGHLISLAVLPQHRREGIGRKLLRKAMEASSPKGLLAEVRKSNLRAQAFYRRMGFRIVGIAPGYYGDEDALILRWTPPPSESPPK